MKDDNDEDDLDYLDEATMDKLSARIKKILDIIGNEETSPFEDMAVLCHAMSIISMSLLQKEANIKANFAKQLSKELNDLRKRESEDVGIMQ